MKILIADDELLVRQSIKLFFFDLGIEEADIEEVDNGLSFVECLKKKHIDLAMVDICMPEMNGLEAIRETKSISTSTDFYVLSGFDDFKYAQEAVRLKVCDYILKPIRRIDLEEIIEKTISRLEQEKIWLTKELKLRIVSMLNEPENTVRFQTHCHPVLVANDTPTRKLSFLEQLEWDNEKLILFAYEKNGYVLLFIFETREYPGYYKEYVKQLEANHKSCYTFIEGKKFILSDQWASEYNRMKKLALYRPIYGAKRIYKSSIQVPNIPADIENICIQCERNILSYIKSDISEFTMSSDNLVQALLQMEDRKDAHFHHFLHFLTDVYEIEASTAKQFKKSILSISSEMTHTPFSRGVKYDEIIDYVNKYYMNPLTVSNLAEMYGLSPNYFSSIFKKKSGYNFVSYLAKIRIEKSKELLLETDWAIQEIAEKVGYYSTSFFIRAFKKLETITPLEYRKVKRGN